MAGIGGGGGGGGGAGGVFAQRNRDATVFVGGLDAERMTEELLWELFLQVGPVVSVFMPKDKVSGALQGYGFVEFRAAQDADYAIRVMNFVRVFGKPIKVDRANAEGEGGAASADDEVGAKLFIGNLSPEVDDKVLFDTFSAFGPIARPPVVAAHEDTGYSKGFGFVSYEDFEASDLAIECMNGQYLGDRQIVVQYAFNKKAPGERHGSALERMYAAERKKTQRYQPPAMFMAPPAMQQPQQQHPHPHPAPPPPPPVPAQPQFLPPPVQPGTFAPPPPPPPVPPPPPAGFQQQQQHQQLLPPPPPPPAPAPAPAAEQQGGSFLPPPPPPPVVPAPPGDQPGTQQQQPVEPPPPPPP